jgi:hypothetical protein
MRKIKPTKKNLRGILNDPEFFRTSYRFRKQTKNIVLPPKLRYVVELIETGLSEEEAIKEAYPTKLTKPKTTLKNMKKKYPYFIQAIEMAKEVYQEQQQITTRSNRMSNKETTTGSSHSNFDADESLQNWREMYSLAKAQQNLTAMINIQANIDKIVNASGQFDAVSKKDKQVFTRDLSETRDDSWKDELGPILKMFESRGISLPSKEDIPTTKRKYTKSGKEKLPRYTSKLKKTETIEDLNPLPNMIFPL